MFRTESINQPGSHRSVILGALLAFALALAVVALAGLAMVKDAVRPDTGSAVTNATTSETLRETWRGVYAGSAAANPATTSETLRETWRGVYAGSAAGASGAGPAPDSQPGEDANGSSTSTNPLHRFGRAEPR